MWRWFGMLGLVLAAPALAQDAEGMESVDEVADVADASLIAPAIPKHRLFLESLTAARINPLGLFQTLSVSYRYRLFESDSRLFSDTFVSIGPVIGLSPAFAKGGAILRVSPIAVLDLQAMYRYQVYFGTFDQALGFDSPTADWSDSGIKARSDEAGPSRGHEITLQHRLQGAVGPVAIRNTGRFVYHDIDLPDGQIAFYDQTPDMISPNGGWTMANELDVLGLFGKFVGGLRYTVVMPFFGDGQGAAGNEIHRVGPLLTYRFHDKPGTAFDQPTLVLLAQWHVVHRFRTGQDVSQALPYLGLAFTFQGDLLPW